MDTLATRHFLRMSCWMNAEGSSAKRAVLVVDDNPDIREMLCEVIESEPGCVAYAAEHGQQALDINACSREQDRSRTQVRPHAPLPSRSPQW
jgi:hypothetical protein